MISFYAHVIGSFDFEIEFEVEYSILYKSDEEEHWAKKGRVTTKAHYSPTPPTGGGSDTLLNVLRLKFTSGGGYPPLPDFGLFLRDVSSETLILVIEPWDVSGETAL